MTSHARFLGSAESFRRRERGLVFQILLLDHRIAEQDKHSRRRVLEQILNHLPSVRRDMLGLVAVVGRVIPFAPDADKPCLQHIYHILVGFQMRFQLLQMAVYPFRRSIHLIALALGVGETQHTFQAHVAERLHVFVKTVQDCLRQILSLEITEVVQHNRHGHLVVFAPIGINMVLDAVRTARRHLAV